MIIVSDTNAPTARVQNSPAKDLRKRYTSCDPPGCSVRPNVRECHVSLTFSGKYSERNSHRSQNPSRTVSRPCQVVTIKLVEHEAYQKGFPTCLVMTYLAPVRS